MQNKKQAFQVCIFTKLFLFWCFFKVILVTQILKSELSINIILCFLFVLLLSRSFNVFYLLKSRSYYASFFFWFSFLFHSFDLKWALLFKIQVFSLLLLKWRLRFHIKLRDVFQDWGRTAARPFDYSCSPSESSCGGKAPDLNRAQRWAADYTFKPG